MFGYKNERVIMDTRKYSVEEMIYRYRENKIVFCNQNRMWGNRKEKTKEILQALARGIPYPPVYASELQTGELLILDKSDKLRALLDHLIRVVMEYGQSDIEEYFINDILYAPITIYVIDYMNPKYMHMQVGNFVEEWSPTQEQAIRNIIYEEDINRIERTVNNTNFKRVSEWVLQYNFSYFLMAVFLKKEKLTDSEYENPDKYQLLDETIKQIKYIDENEWNKLYAEFEECIIFVNQQYAVRRRVGMNLTEIKMKYLCFSYLCRDMRSVIMKNRYDSLWEREGSEVIENCDMSYRGIRKTIDILERRFKT